METGERERIYFYITGKMLPFSDKTPDCFCELLLAKERFYVTDKWDSSKLFLNVPMKYMVDMKLEFYLREKDKVFDKQNMVAKKSLFHHICAKIETTDSQFVQNMIAKKKMKYEKALHIIFQNENKDLFHKYFYQLDGTEKELIQKFHAIKRNVEFEG